MAADSGKRKLRQPSESMRERAERAASKGTKRRLRFLAAVGRPFATIGRLRIWKPFRFIGRFLVPPYLRNSWHELRQTTWPNGKQTWRLTGAVILFSFIFGVLVAILDYGLDKLFKQVIAK